MRSWALWLTFLLLAASLGWFWLLSHDLTFRRADQPEPKTTTAEQKSEGKKNG